jgi:hypothetical protein
MPPGSVVVEAREVADIACFDVDPPGGITVAAQARVSGAELGSTLTVLAERWMAQGCQVLDDRRNDPLPRFKVQSPDGFWLRASTNGKGELVITASSPCLWPEATTSPLDGGNA